MTTSLHGSMIYLALVTAGRTIVKGGRASWFQVALRSNDYVVHMLETVGTLISCSSGRPEVKMEDENGGGGGGVSKSISGGGPTSGFSVYEYNT